MKSILAVCFLFLGLIAMSGCLTGDTILYSPDKNVLNDYNGANFNDYNIVQRSDRNYLGGYLISIDNDTNIVSVVGADLKIAFDSNISALDLNHWFVKQTDGNNWYVKQIDGNNWYVFQGTFDLNVLRVINSLDLNNSLDYLKSALDTNNVTAGWQDDTGKWMNDLDLNNHSIIGHDIVTNDYNIYNNGYLRSSQSKNYPFGLPGFGVTLDSNATVISQFDDNSSLVYHHADITPFFGSIYDMTSAPLINDSNDYNYYFSDSGGPGAVFLSGCAGEEQIAIGGIYQSNGELDGIENIGVALIAYNGSTGQEHSTIYFNASCFADQAAFDADMGAFLPPGYVVDYFELEMFTAGGAGADYVWNNPATLALVDGATDPPTVTYFPYIYYGDFTIQKVINNGTASTMAAYMLVMEDSSDPSGYRKVLEYGTNGLYLGGGTEDIYGPEKGGDFVVYADQDDNTAFYIDSGHDYDIEMGSENLATQPAVRIWGDLELGSTSGSTYTFPTNGPAASQYLGTNGAGTFGWQNAGAGGITGSGTLNSIAIFDGVNSIRGDSNLSFNGFDFFVNEYDSGSTGSNTPRVSIIRDAGTVDSLSPLLNAVTIGQFSLGPRASNGTYQNTAGMDAITMQDFADDNHATKLRFYSTDTNEATWTSYMNIYEGLVSIGENYNGDSKGGTISLDVDGNAIIQEDITADSFCFNDGSGCATTFTDFQWNYIATQDINMASNDLNDVVEIFGNTDDPLKITAGTSDNGGRGIILNTGNTTGGFPTTGGDLNIVMGSGGTFDGELTVIFPGDEVAFNINSATHEGLFPKGLGVGRPYGTDVTEMLDVNGWLVVTNSGQVGIRTSNPDTNTLLDIDTIGGSSDAFKVFPGKISIHNSDESPLRMNEIRQIDTLNNWFDVAWYLTGDGDSQAKGEYVLTTRRGTGDTTDYEKIRINRAGVMTVYDDLNVQKDVNAERFCVDGTCIDEWSDVNGSGFWAANGADIYNSNPDGVAIGRNTALAMLDVNSLNRNEIRATDINTESSSSLTFDVNNKTLGQVGAIGYEFSADSLAGKNYIYSTNDSNGIAILSSGTHVDSNIDVYNGGIYDQNRYLRITNDGNLGYGKQISRVPREIYLTRTQDSAAGRDEFVYINNYVAPTTATTSVTPGLMSYTTLDPQGVNMNGEHSGTESWLETKAGSGESINNAYAMYSRGVHSGAGTVNNFWGYAAEIYNNSNGRITNAAGLFFRAINYSSGSIGNAYGVRMQVLNMGSGKIENAYGGYFDVDKVWTGYIDRAVGGYVADLPKVEINGQSRVGFWINGFDDTNHGGLTDVNQFGLYIGDVRDANIPDAYAIYSAGGKVYFKDDVNANRFCFNDGNGCLISPDMNGVDVNIANLVPYTNAVRDVNIWKHNIIIDDGNLYIGSNIVQYGSKDYVTGRNSTFVFGGGGNSIINGWYNNTILGSGNDINGNYHNAIFGYTNDINGASDSILIGTGGKIDGHHLVTDSPNLYSVLISAGLNGVNPTLLPYNGDLIGLGVDGYPEIIVEDDKVNIAGDLNVDGRGNFKDLNIGTTANQTGFDKNGYMTMKGNAQNWSEIFIPAGSCINPLIEGAIITDISRGAETTYKQLVFDSNVFSNLYCTMIIPDNYNYNSDEDLNIMILYGILDDANDAAYINLDVDFASSSVNEYIDFNYTVGGSPYPSLLGKKRMTYYITERPYYTNNLIMKNSGLLHFIIRRTTADIYNSGVVIYGLRIKYPINRLGTQYN